MRKVLFFYLILRKTVNHFPNVEPFLIDQRQHRHVHQQDIIISVYKYAAITQNWDGIWYLFLGNYSSNKAWEWESQRADRHAEIRELRDKEAGFDNKAREASGESLKQVGLMSKSSILVFVRLL